MRKKKTQKTLKIIPLGGVSHIGKNITAIEYGENIIVIDCGLLFPRENMPGIDYIIPDTTYLENNKQKVKAFVFTHGHEDHIGASPYILPKFDVPIYATRLTAGLIELKFIERDIKLDKMNFVESGDRVNIGPFEVEFVRVSHSIDDSVGLIIKTPVGNIVHTGDFKIDYTPVGGKLMELSRFAEIGTEGVLALMSDSTNAEKPGFTISEKMVGETFSKFFANAKGRIIIATFASNIHRVQQVVDEAKRYGKKICLIGRSMIKVSTLAMELGYLQVPEKMMITPEQLKTTRDNKVVILTTGSQGEPMSGLVRSAAGENPNFSIKKDDLVIISSTPIPGNEVFVNDVINRLYKLGAEVVYEGLEKVHVSGHACQEELKLMLALTNPKFFIPVHGEYRHLFSHSGIASKLGMKSANIFVPELGVPIELSQTHAKRLEPVPSGDILIDGLGVGDIGNSVLGERRVLSEDGILMAVLTISKQTFEIVSGPEIITRGFIYVKDHEDIIETTRKRVREITKQCLSEKITDGNTLKVRIKKSLSGYLYSQTKRNPIILPIILEV